MSRIAALVLAAGASRRFGSDKRLAQLPDGRVLLDATLGLYLETVGDCWVVLDEADGHLCARVAALGGRCVTVRGVRSGNAVAGMGDSLAAGARHIAAAGYDGCLVALGDMPCVAPATVRSVAAALDRRRLVVPVRKGRWGHPVGFGAAFFSQLCALQGARGAAGLLRDNRRWRCELPVSDAGVLLDVDTPAQLRQLAACSTHATGSA